MALRFEDMLERLGDQGRKALLDTYELYQSGLIDRDTMLDVASELLQFINDQGAAYGALSYSQVRAIMLDTATELPAKGTPLASTSTGGISASLTTILNGDPEQIAQRLERLGYVLPIESAQGGYESTLQGDSAVEGWQRGLNDDACQLCQWWSWDGRIWPKVQPFQKHIGCKCQQIPKIAHEDEIPSTVYERKLKRRQEAIANRDRRIAEAIKLMD